MTLAMFGAAVLAMLGLTLWRRRTRWLGMIVAANWSACAALGWAQYPALDMIAGTLIALSLYSRRTWEGFVLFGLYVLMMGAHVLFWAAYEAGRYYGQAYGLALDALFSLALIVVSIDGGCRVATRLRGWLLAGLDRSRRAPAGAGVAASPKDEAQ